jgi:hypothetical protein
MIFKRDLLKKVLKGEKTQTRRTHVLRLTVGRVYGIKTQYYEKTRGHILITARWNQRLGDMTEAEARAEGFSSLGAFRLRWAQINGTYDPNLIVTAYEFRLEKCKKMPKRGDIRCVWETRQSGYTKCNLHPGKKKCLDCPFADVYDLKHGWVSYEKEEA